MTISAANDNWPKVYTVGLGNLPWRVNEKFGDLNEREIATASEPLCSLHEILIQSIEWMRSKELSGGHHAVYVIGDVYGRECKIGKAANPINRLAQLQTGNHRQLFLHRVFWMREREASSVEALAHRIAEGSYDRLIGEWFRCSPNEAHEAIECAIEYRGNIQSYCVVTPANPLIEAAA